MADAKVDLLAFDINEQPLGAALLEFGKQGRLSVMAASDLTRNRRSHAVRGRMQTDTALKTMLAGTGLSYRFVGQNSVLISEPHSSKLVAAPHQPNVASEAEISTPEGGLGEIVVTAERTVSSVQRTSIAINTVSGDEVVQRGVQDAKDLNRLIPDLTVSSPGQTGDAFYIRGVGSMNNTAYSDAAIAFSLDQTYFSRAYGPGLSLFDVERIEVLKGPQGTLYGRNATGGAVNVVTRKPTFTQTANIAVEVGSYNLAKITAAANVPLSDALALRGAFQAMRHDGYLSDGYDDADTASGRLHALYKPTSDFSLLISANYLTSGGQGPGVVPYENNKYLTGDPWLGGSSPEVVAYTLSKAGNVANMGADGVNPYVVRTDGFNRIRVLNVSADLEWNLGPATLTVLPSYLRTRQRQRFYDGPTAFAQTNNARQISLEGRLASSTDQPLSWILGGFYLRENQFYQAHSESVFGHYASTVYQPHIVDETYAGFGQLTYKANDILRLIGGLRYSKEKKTSLNSMQGTLYYDPSDDVSYSAGDSRLNFSSTNFKAGAEFDAAPRSMIYANVSTGFHAGGINPGSAPNRTQCPADLSTYTDCDFSSTYAPEKLTAFALGSKNRFFGNKLQINLEGYYWKYKDLQVGHIGLVNDGEGGSYTSYRFDNVGSAKLYGVEFDIKYLLTPDDVLTVNGLYNHSRYGNFVILSQYGLFEPSRSDHSGKQFLQSPTWSGTVAYEHTFHLSNGGSITASASSRLSSKVILAFEDEEDAIQKRYSRTDLDLSYSAPEAGWSIGAYVRNLENGAQASGASSRLGTGTVWTSVAPPRTYGVMARSKF